MKKLLLLLIFCFSQIMISQQVVDVRLVNENIGFALSSFFNIESNDDGLNIILQNNNINRYQFKLNHPYQPYSNKMMEIECDCDVNKLVNDLNAYSTVVEKAVISDYGIFKDAITCLILNDGIGIPTDVNNSIAITNDEGLNQIFENFNVFYYNNWCDNCLPNHPLLKRAFNIVCDCDNTALKIALDNYTSVIETADYAGAFYYLKNKCFEQFKSVITPNPFSSTFSITTKELISEYAVFDISGKQIIKTNSKPELDNQTENLKTGIYVLELKSVNDEVIHHKIVKR